MNTPSHVTPCPSVPEHVVPEHDTDVDPGHDTEQTASWECVAPSSEGAAEPGSSSAPPHPMNESATNNANMTPDGFMCVPPAWTDSRATLTREAREFDVPRPTHPHDEVSSETGDRIVSPRSTSSSISESAAR